MAYIFGDGFDLYATYTDAYPTYWDSDPVGGGFIFVAGRFAGSQAAQLNGNSATTGWLLKSSGANDAVHHITVAIDQLGTVSGTNLGQWFTFYDAQCSIFFRSDGAILLTSGAANGTTLATYTGAITAQNTWYAFEMEVVINNTTGSFTVRKNGNTSNDFTIGSLNTRAGSTNNYANRIAIGTNWNAGHNIDDLLWRSDASSVPWVGDVRCYTRMPASDASIHWSRAGNSPVTPFGNSNFRGLSAGTAYYTPFVAACDGQISTVNLTFNSGYTGNLKGAIFAASGPFIQGGSGGVPTTVLSPTATVSNPATGTVALTFSPPVTVTKGTTYFVGIDSDTSSGSTTAGNNSPSCGYSAGLAYASFPAANPTGLGGWPTMCITAIIAFTANYQAVSENQQDGATSYVYDNNVGDADLYGISSISGTPSSIVAVTTRGYFEKSDAGTRNAAVQIKSGTTTVNSGSAALNTTWGWMYRTDTTDPNTGSAWTATAVNSAQIGPIVTA
jgi:hypothetical protein